MFFRYTYFRAIVICTNVLTKTLPDPLLEGEAFRTHEMGFIGPIRLIRLIIRHYENDEDLGFGFDGGYYAAGGMPTGEGGTGEDAPAESSRTAAVDSTRMEMELIEWVGAGVELDR